MDYDPVYTPGSADNKHIYQHEHLLGETEYGYSSRHSLRVLESNVEIGSCILLAVGGATGVHEHSALVHQTSYLAAIGPFLCSLTLPSLQLEWQLQVDWATCFGIYHSQKHKCYISHGELQIARVSYTGDLIWRQGGKDIFTGDFELQDDYIEVVDFNDETYRIEISSGVSRLVAV